MSASKTAYAADFADARLAERVAAEVLAGRFRWAAGLGWLRWDGTRWAEGSEVEITEEVRAWAIREFDAVAQEVRTGQADAEAVKKHLVLLTRSKVRAVVDFAKGIPGVRTDAASFDSDPYALNTPNGVVDLRCGYVTPHHPAQLHTKVTRGCYLPGFTHPDWDQALTALPPAEQWHMQARFGQAVTGHPTPDGVMPLLQGSGENGKSLFSTDGVLVALGDYAHVAPEKLLTSAAKEGDHSTEKAFLRGRRLLMAEEMTEGHALNVTTLKRVQDVGQITARFVYRDNITFPATHSLFTTSNYLPVVNETDHGTWRRLELVRFPYTFVKPGQPLERPDQRAGDPQLKGRIKAGTDKQHDAIVTWVVDGAVRYYRDGAACLAPTPRIETDTRQWRSTADRVLGYWDERLIVDHDSCVLADELLDDFNAWLAENGHRSWARETFIPRFAEHSETRRAAVEPARPRATSVASTTGVASTERSVPGLWRRAAPGLPLRPLPARPYVWRGVRWRTEADSLLREPTAC